MNEYEIKDERMRWLYCCFQWPFSHDLLGVSSILLKNGHFIHFNFKPLERPSPPFCGWSGTFHDACISTDSPLSMSNFFLFAPFRWTCSRTLLHLRSIVCFTQKPLLSLSHWCSLFFLLGWSHRWLCPPPPHYKRSFELVLMDGVQFLYFCPCGVFFPPRLVIRLPLSTVSKDLIATMVGKKAIKRNAVPTLKKKKAGWI